MKLARLTLRHMRMSTRAAAGLLLVLAVTPLLGACNATSNSVSADESTSLSTPSPPVSAEPTEPAPSLAFPPNFIKKMKHSGYVLETADGNTASTTREQAIENGRNAYGLYTAGDPVVAEYFLVTTPEGGQLEDPSDPESDIIKPTLDQTPMWVVYALADVFDDGKMVDGHVVVFVEGATGDPRSAITF